MLMMMTMMRAEVVDGPDDGGDLKVRLESGETTGYIHKSHLLVRGVPWL